MGSDRVSAAEYAILTVTKTHTRGPGRPRGGRLQQQLSASSLILLSLTYFSALHDV